MTAPSPGSRNSPPSPALRDLLMHALCEALIEEGYEKPPADWDQLAAVAAHYTGRPVPPVKPSDFDFLRNLTVEQFAAAITRAKTARYQEQTATGEPPAAHPPGTGPELE